MIETLSKTMRSALVCRVFCKSCCAFPKWACCCAQILQQTWKHPVLVYCKSTSLSCTGPCPKSLAICGLKLELCCLTCGVWTLFRSVEDAEIELGKQWVVPNHHSTGCTKVCPMRWHNMISNEAPWHLPVADAMWRFCFHTLLDTTCKGSTQRVFVGQG